MLEHACGLSVSSLCVTLFVVLLQDELDTVREEAHFRQHYLEEKENQLEETKRTVASLEVDLEVQYNNGLPCIRTFITNQT